MTRKRLGGLIFTVVVWAAVLVPDKAFGQLRRIETTNGGISNAVIVKNRSLIHTAQLLPIAEKVPQIVSRGDAGKQFKRVMQRLETVLSAGGASLQQIVRLNVYVTSDSVAEVVRKQLAVQFKKEHTPAVSFVVTPLSDAAALVAVDAVAATSITPKTATVVRRRAGRSALTVIPYGKGRLIYISGQAERARNLAESTRNTMSSLHRTLKYLKGSPKHVVHIKTFFRPMKDVSTVEREIRRVYPKGETPPVSHVQWTSRLIEIEMVAFVPYKPGEERASEPVRYVTPPWMKSSPVFSRVAIVESNELIFISGMYGRKGNDAKQQVTEIFTGLKRVSKKAGSDLRHLVKATYYVAGGKVSSELNRQRPRFYDLRRPPAASKAGVSAVGLPGRSITLDMIAVPRK